jgi:hypothetical protein
MAAKKRGTKANPYEVGDEVDIYPLDRRGVVTRQIFPPFRGHMRYEVEYSWHGGKARREFHNMQLDEVKQDEPHQV